MQRILLYIYRVGEPRALDDFRALVAKEIGKEVEEDVVTMEDILIERGIQKGLQEGRQEGEQEGRRTVLLKQLRIRFGELPSAVVARIQAAGAVQLDVWAERVLTASTLEEALAAT